MHKRRNSFLPLALMLGMTGMHYKPDPDPATPPAPGAPPPPPAAGSPPPPPAPAELSAEVKGQLKELADLKAAKEKADREALSESDRLKKDADDARAEARAALADSVAARHGLPDELAARLVGTTKAELEADAKKLAALLPPATPPAPGNTGVPPGGNPPPAPGENEAIKTKRAELEAAKKAGKVMDVLRLGTELAALQKPAK